MASAYWKTLERRHAGRFLNGKRILRDGTAKPDGESGSDVWEAKCRQSFAVLSGKGMFRERAKAYAEYTGDRRFHMVIHEYSKHEDFVLCRAEDYAELVKTEGRAWLLGYMDADADERTRL